MNTLEGKDVKSPFGAAITADASGEIPKVIDYLKVGNWRTPYHGDFMITPEDLEEYVANFKAAVALPDKGSKGAPIDYKHENYDKAAGWIKKFTIDGDTLKAHVKWTPAGKQAILDEEFCFFSPEFYPKGRGGWMDPENYEHIVDNVATGGGLTNIPLFKTLGALTASANGRREYRTSEVYINASEIKEIPAMSVAEQIAELRKLNVSELTEDQKTFVTAHAADMSDEDKKHFGLEGGVAAAAQAAIDNKNKETTDVTVDAETAQIAADIKAGKSVVISASAYQKMQDDAKAQQAQVDSLRRKDILASVDKHIERGAIKADQRDKWADRIMADETMLQDLENLNGNTAMGGVQGSSTAATDVADSAPAELHEKTVAAVKASAEKGAALSYSEARREVLASDKELAEKIKNNEA